MARRPTHRHPTPAAHHHTHPTNRKTRGPHTNPSKLPPRWPIMARVNPYAKVETTRVPAATAEANSGTAAHAHHDGPPPVACRWSLPIRASSPASPSQPGPAMLGEQLPSPRPVVKLLPSRRRG